MWLYCPAINIVLSCSLLPFASVGFVSSKLTDRDQQFKWVPHSLSPVAYRDAATAPFVMLWPLGGTVRGTVRAAESRWDGPVSTFPLHHHHLLPWPSPPPPHPPICHAHGSPTHQMETVFPSWAYLVSNPPGRSKNQPYTIGRQHKSGILRNSRSDGLLMVEIKTDHML